MPPEWPNLSHQVRNKSTYYLLRVVFNNFCKHYRQHQIKILLGITHGITTLFLASALYVQQPPNPLRAVIALGSAVAISVTVTSTLLLFAKVYDSNRRSTI